MLCGIHKNAEQAQLSSILDQDGKAGRREKRKGGGP